jgi:hypothetical protein
MEMAAVTPLFLILAGSYSAAFLPSIQNFTGHGIYNPEQDHEFTNPVLVDGIHPIDEQGLISDITLELCSKVQSQQ